MRIFSNWMLAMAAVGIAGMLVENELRNYHFWNEDSPRHVIPVLVASSVVSATTLVLLVLLLLFYRAAVKFKVAKGAHPSGTTLARNILCFCFCFCFVLLYVDRPHFLKKLHFSIKINKIPIFR